MVVVHVTEGRALYCFAAVVPVDLFFSLSGFLIAQMIAERFDGISTPAAFWAFMGNRWLRTIPLYFLALGANLGILIIFALQSVDIPPIFARFALFVQYIPWYHDGEAWQPNFFTVSWSLAVEEWFYLLCPLLLLLAAGRSRRFFLSMAAGLVAASIAYRLAICLVDPAMTQAIIFRSTLTRADSFVFGIAAYFVTLHGLSKRLSMVCAAGSLLLAALNAWLIASVTFGLYTKALIPSLAPLSMALLIPAALTLKAPTIIAKAAAWLSTRTYAIYLFHTLVIAFIFAPGHHTALRLLAFVVATGLLADFLYRYVERPFMRLRPVRAPAAILGPTPLPAERS